MKIKYLISLILLTMAIVGLNAKRQYTMQNKENKQDNPKSGEIITLDSTMVFFIDEKRVPWAEFERQVKNGELEPIDILKQQPKRTIMLYGEKYRNGIGIYKTIEK